MYDAYSSASAGRTDPFQMRAIMARDPTAMRIDHVIYATADLDAAAARVEAALGIAAAGGGRHDGLGTHNRIVPLGGGYVELLAIADPDEAAGSWLGAAVQERIARHGDGLFGWAVAVERVEDVAARLGTPSTTIARQGMTARLTAVGEAMREPAGRRRPRRTWARPPRRAAGRSRRRDARPGRRGRRRRRRRSPSRSRRRRPPATSRRGPTAAGRR